MTIYEFMEMEFGQRGCCNIVEVGAHVGSDTERLSRFVGSGWLVAFEPDPRDVVELRSVAQQLGTSVTIMDKAVGASEGTATFYLSSGAASEGDGPHTASSSLRAPKNHLKKFPWVHFDDTIKVEVTTLDASCPAGEIDMLWLDVQGAEMDVVRGGQEVLRRTRFLFTEFNDGEMYEGQSGLSEILAALPGSWGIVKIFGDEVLLQNKDFGNAWVQQPIPYLSIVMQGPVLEHTPEAIASVRHWFPGGEIVLSTWADENTEGLDVDHLVQVGDPGGGTEEDYHYGRGNMARLIVGCAAGVAAASHNHILKIRTDTIFDGNGVMSHVHRWPKRSPGRMSVFEDKIIVPNIGTADPEVHVCYQISDWVAFGTKGDLTLLFDVPTENITNTRKSPEQNMWLHAIRRVRPELDIDHIDHKTPEAIAGTIEFMSNNLVILDTKAQFNFHSGKYPWLPDDQPVNMRHSKWARWYGEMP